MRSEAYLVQLAKNITSHRQVVWRKFIAAIGLCESAPIACELLGVVVTGKITSDWIVLKTVLRLVIFREMFEGSLQDYAIFKIALSQLIVCSALGWNSYASLILLG
jgi:hypothetical protein